MARQYKIHEPTYSTNLEKYRILTKPGMLVNRDIRVLLGCSMSVATDTISRIRLWLAKQGIHSEAGHIAAEAFIEFMKWDFDKIKKYAFEEMQCMQMAKGADNV
jgi:hypothetical protein